MYLTTMKVFDAAFERSNKSCKRNLLLNKQIFKNTLTNTKNESINFVKLNNRQ